VEVLVRPWYQSSKSIVKKLGLDTTEELLLTPRHYLAHRPAHTLKRGPDSGRKQAH